MPKTIQDRFFNDPEWHLVEEMILSYMAPLLDMTSIEKTQPAEDVKAQMIAREMSYDSMFDFLSQARILTGEKPKVIKSKFR